MRGRGKHYERKVSKLFEVGSFLVVSQAVERRGDREEALSLFDRAVQLAPENALVRYRRAKILISMKKYSVSSRTTHQSLKPLTT